MPITDYGDFVYSSEEENQEMEEQDDHDLDEEGSVGSDHISVEVDHSSDDFDNYASFNTDLERYQYDQLLWNGIPNLRKYTIAQKNDKGETKRPKRKKSKEDEAETTTKEGEIHFDCEENLWYTYKKMGIYLTERATFHHWIRPGLSQLENAKGTYEFARQKGPGHYNITCFNEVEKHWGLQRPHYAPVMFEWERLHRKDPTYSLGNLYYQGLLVIDYWRTPIRNFLEIPLVISSAFEGGYMEPATRLHSEMAYEDIRARMPPFVETIKNGVTTLKALSKASTLSGRSRHFREKAGAISWDMRDGSSNIKSFIEDIVKPVDNSTQGSRDLTKDELKRLRLMNHGTKPGRAKPGTTKESKEKYIADTRKAAGLPAPIPMDEASGKDDEKHEQTSHAENYDYLYEVSDDQSQDGLTSSMDDNRNEEDESAEMDVSAATPPRFVFRCTDDNPSLRAMTEEEALMHPLVDVLDPRNHIPKILGEHYAILDALQVTVDHYKEIFGAEPTISQSSNYISQYCSIQDQVDEVFPHNAIALRRLGRWEGTVFDWARAEVEDDPCIGRRQPL